MAIDPTDFSEPVKRKLAERAGQTCSNPDCNKPTSGGHTDKDKSVIIGEAAHIYGQKLGSKRFDPSKTAKDLSDINNAIWLCSVCHKQIDTDEEKYTVQLLQRWKTGHESTVLIGKGGQIKEMAKDIKDIKNALESLGLKQSVPISAPDVLEDKNIKLSIEAWGKGQIKEAYEYAKEAYFNTSGHVKLQAIINLILLSGDDSLKNAGYYISLCDEGIALANHLRDVSSSAVIKAHKAYFLQNKTFETSLQIYGEVMARQVVGFPTMTSVELVRLSSEVNANSKLIDTLVYEAQKEAFDVKDWSALAHVKVTVANAIGLTYFLTHQMGGDCGPVEHQTVKYFLEAKSIYEQLKDEVGVATVLHNLANNLRFFGDKKRAIEYSKQALEIAKKIGYTELIDKGKELLEDRLNNAND